VKKRDTGYAFLTLPGHAVFIGQADLMSISPLFEILVIIVKLSGCSKNIILVKK
jgi:hypothetical protein